MYRGNLGPFFRLHQLFTADDVACIHTPADLIHCYGESTNAALIDIALLYALLYHFLRSLLLDHDFLLVITQFVSVSLDKARMVDPFLIAQQKPPLGFRIFLKPLGHQSFKNHMMFLLILPYLFEDILECWGLC